MSKCFGTAVGVLVAIVASLASPAGAAKPNPVSVVASGLHGPFSVHYAGGRLLVAEPFADKVSSIDLRTGAATVLVTGVISPTSALRIGSEIVVLTAGSLVPDSSITGNTSVLVARNGAAPTVLADLLAYELANNPDGQLQFDPVTGAALDSLSNPFSMIEQRGSGYVLVADGGANAVLSVSRTGDVSTFFVPPVINTGACEGRPNNDADHTGCDAVPTGLAYGPRNTLYVSTLAADVPGEGRIYVLEANTGKVLRVLTGFTGPTGVAVTPDGTIYVSEVFGESEGPPGRIVRVAPDGSRTYAPVPFPTGINFHGGVLYVTAWSLGEPGSGQILALSPAAFS